MLLLCSLGCNSVNKKFWYKFGICYVSAKLKTPRITMKCKLFIDIKKNNFLDCCIFKKRLIIFSHCLLHVLSETQPGKSKVVFPASLPSFEMWNLSNYGQIMPISTASGKVISAQTPPLPINRGRAYPTYLRIKILDTNCVLELLPCKWF